MGDAMKPKNKKAKTGSATGENPSAVQILLVEDAAENRLLIQAFLNKTPFHIDAVSYTHLRAHET